MLVALLLISGFHTYEEWSVGDFIGVESFYARATLSVWKPKEWSNGTEKLWQETFNTSPASVAIGVVAGIAKCCEWLQEHIVLDILLLLSLGMRGHMTRLIRIIQDENASLELKWEEYDKMKLASSKINATFEYFLYLAHVNNLFLLSYFLLGAFDEDTQTVYLILFAAMVGKILVMYHVASATAHKVRT